MPDIEAVMQEVAAWGTRRNQAQMKIDWRFTIADVRNKLGRLNPAVKEQVSA